MSENSEREEIDRKGNEWEVVALTESTYAAAPGPQQDIPYNSCSEVSCNAETASLMFMSGHFGLSSSILENLQQENEYMENYREKGRDHDVPQLTVQQGCGESDIKHEENLNIEGLMSNEFPAVPRYVSDFGGAASSKLMEKEHGMPNVPKNIEEDKSGEPLDLPCGGWWRRQAASLYGRVRNANPYWSIVVAAAVVGFVIIGHRWQRDKPKVFQLKSQVIVDDEGFPHCQLR